MENEDKGVTKRGTTLVFVYAISGRLKHPFSLAPIDRYSLGKLIFKISVGYDFTLARYAE